MEIHLYGEEIWINGKKYKVLNNNVKIRFTRYELKSGFLVRDNEIVVETDFLGHPKKTIPITKGLSNYMKLVNEFVKNGATISETEASDKVILSKVSINGNFISIYIQEDYVKIEYKGKTIDFSITFNNFFNSSVTEDAWFHLGVLVSLMEYNKETFTIFPYSHSEKTEKISTFIEKIVSLDNSYWSGTNIKFYAKNPYDEDHVEVPCPRYVQSSSDVMFLYCAEDRILIRKDNSIILTTGNLCLIATLFASPIEIKNVQIVSDGYSSTNSIYYKKVEITIDNKIFTIEALPRAHVLIEYYDFVKKLHENQNLLSEFGLLL